MFPIDPKPEHLDVRGLFLVQDNRLLETVLPLYSFSNDALDDRPIGHGTTFRIDPWARCATAYHVIEDIVVINNYGAPDLHPARRLATLELQLSYGVTRVEPSAWQGLSGMFTIVRKEQRPLQLPEAKNFSELALLRVAPGGMLTHKAPHLPVKLSGWFPKVGDKVMAFGYADLDVDKFEEGDDRPLEQRLYGAVGKIVQIDRADPTTERPWPRIWVEGAWPGGMSGGPVFNENGHVIGLVSSGIGDSVACATFFSGWDLPRQIFDSLDPLNPGRFLVIGMFDGDDELVAVSEDVDQAERYAASKGLSIRFISYDPTAEEWMTHHSDH